MSGIESLKDVTLRPWPAPNKDELNAEDLMRQVEQLTAERGHLRNITERSLQDDIIAGKDVPDDAVEGQEEEKEKKDAPSRAQRQQDIIRLQQEMSSHMEYVPHSLETTGRATNCTQLGQICCKQCGRPSLPRPFRRPQKALGLVLQPHFPY